MQFAVPMWAGAAPAPPWRPGVDSAAAADAALVAAAHADPAAFEALYRRHLPGVYRYIYARVGSVAEAEDLTAAAFVDAMTSLGRYEEQGRFCAWLYTIARRQVSGYRRRRRRETGLGLGDDDVDLDQVAGTPSRRLAALEEGDQLVAALATLSDDQREALALRFFGDLKVGEIAAIMGKGESAVKMILHRGLQQLRAVIEPAEVRRDGR